MVIEIAHVMRKLNGVNDTTSVDNIIYGQVLWKSLNNSPNIFRGLKPIPVPHPVREICDNCSEPIEGLIIEHEGKRLCERCHSDMVNYTSKW
jgi:hypothetical protein